MTLERKEEYRTHNKLLFYPRRTTHTFVVHHEMNVGYLEGLVAQCVRELDPTIWSLCEHYAVHTAL